MNGTITAKPQVFAAAVKWAAKFVAAKPAVPIQGCLRLTAGDGRLLIESYSENISATATVPVGGDGFGTVVVSGRLLDQLVGTFPDRPVEIAAAADGIEITAGRWKGTLPTMNPDDWPMIEVLPPAAIGTVDGTAFADLVRRTAVAAADDVSKRVALACVHLTFDGGSAVARATDSYRAVGASAPFSTPVDSPVEDLSALVIAQTLADVAGAFAGPDQIAVGLGPNVLSLESPTRYVIVRQVAETYELAGVIDRAAAADLPRSATVKVADLLGPMKRAVLMTDGAQAKKEIPPIGVVISEGVITVHAKATQIQKKGSEDVDAEYEGPEHTMALNPEYLADALTTAPSDTVVIRFNEQEQRPGRPWHAVLSVPGDHSWRHVLMPIKVRG